MPCIARIEELAPEFTRIRREFHAHPELSNQEFETAKTIARYLTEWGIEVHTGIGGTGVVGILKNGDGAKRIAFAIATYTASDAAWSFSPKAPRIYVKPAPLRSLESPSSAPTALGACRNHRQDRTAQSRF